MKVRIGVIALVLVALVGFTSPASACEKCVSAGYNGWVQCSSGHASGSQSCYGGFGRPCTLDGSCGSGGGGVGDPLHPEAVMSEPCLTCGGEKPTQGFMLLSEDAPQAEGSADLSGLEE